MSLTLEFVLEIHNRVLEKHGGLSGVRDNNGLLSAIGRPFQTFDGNDLYEDVFQKSAALGESIIVNHPFLDGNKRTGYVLMEYYLRINNFKIIASDDDLYSFIISISIGQLKFDDIVIWLKNNTILSK